MHSLGAHLLTLFRTCTDLRVSFYKLDKDAEVIREIAMNASVAAGQTGKFIRVYTEIANQIAITARKMKNHIALSREEIHTISNLTLQSLVLENRLQKYEESHALIEDEDNKYILKKQLQNQNETVFDIMKNIHAHLYPTQSHLKNLLQTQYRLFGALSNLRIEATELSGSQFTAIITLSENLFYSTEKAIENIDGIFKIINILKHHMGHIKLKQIA